MVKISIITKNRQVAWINFISSGLNEEHPYVFICHGDAAEQAEKEKAAILEAVPQAQVIIMPMSPIIGIHTGPGVQAVIYFGNNR